MRDSCSVRSKARIASIRLAAISVGGKTASALRLLLARALVVARDPPARIEEQRVRLHIGAGPEPQQDVLAQPEQPAEIGVGLGPARRQHDAGEPLWVLDREDLRDRAAGRMADDMRPLDLQRIHQPDHVGRHAVDGKAAARQVALADPAMVVGDDVEGLGEGGDLVVPERGKPAQPRHEHDGEPDTLALVIERAVADYDPRHRSATGKNPQAGITSIRRGAVKRRTRRVCASAHAWPHCTTAARPLYTGRAGRSPNARRFAR